MTVSLAHALDGARLVRAQERLGDVTELYVWSGGHTINVYVSHPGLPSDEVRPADCISVGSFENDAASRTEVEDTMTDLIADANGDS